MKIRLDSAFRQMESDPYLGKPLRGELSGKWSLRVGDYRVIYKIDEQEKSLTLLNVGHRKAVYK